jgi:uncharacterized membrane protein YhiD involved in acid resistance
MTGSPAELLVRIAAAFAIGLLLGLERGWQLRELSEGKRVAGLRTFGLLSVLGARSRAWCRTTSAPSSRRLC